MAKGDDDAERELEALRRVAKDVREGGGFRFKSRSGRDTEEGWDAAQALAALGFGDVEVKHRGRYDPPDWEAVVEGERWGIEITELLDEQTLIQRKRRTGYAWREWTREDFLLDLGEAIRRKDNPTDVKDPRMPVTCWQFGLTKCTLRRKPLSSFWPGSRSHAR